MHDTQYTCSTRHALNIYIYTNLYSYTYTYTYLLFSCPVLLEPEWIEPKWLRTYTYTYTYTYTVYVYAHHVYV